MQCAQVLCLLRTAGRAKHWDTSIIGQPARRALDKVDEVADHRPLHARRDADLRLRGRAGMGGQMFRHQ